MRIVHICLSGAFTDNWNYQENLLTKYHKKMGYDVIVITSKWGWSTNGNMVIYDKSDYVNDDGVRIIRLSMKGKENFKKKFKRYCRFYALIVNLKPDIIFIHGIQFIDIKYIVKYVKNNPNIKVYIDNHADYYNSAKNFLSKNILHKIIWKYYARITEPYTTKFYGVLPARVDFLKDMYNIPEEKIELLVMGADDEKVKEAKNPNIRKEIRSKHRIKEDDFLIITGGKIDSNKPETLSLMQAVKEINESNIKLIVFGSVTPELKKRFNELLCDNVIFIGWIDPKETYNYFSAADLIVFPGLHSVFWEQAVALGKACVFRYIEGFTHVDLGGNCKFIFEASVSEIKKVVIGIANNREVHEYMTNIALTKGLKNFSYKKIAEMSISVK